jgi:predicted aspartyl protease
MSEKWLRYDAAKQNPYYKQLIPLAIDYLTKRGVFERERLIKETNLGPFSDAIRWDYVVRMVEEETKVELIPLAASFFERHDHTDDPKVPQKYLASGHGKRTVGYAVASKEHGHFVIAQLVRKQKVALGMVKGADKTHASAVKAGIDKVEGQK